MPIPDEPVVGEKGMTRQESFSVDMRSIPGSSGSPVVVTIDPSSIRANKDGIMYQIPTGNFYQWLLGIDWCHFPYYSDVLDDAGKKIEPRQRVKLNSGIAGVIPAWKLAEMLHMDDVKRKRAQSDTHEEERRKRESEASLD
jgi:hypothetical protein